MTKQGWVHIISQVYRSWRKCNHLEFSSGTKWPIISGRNLPRHHIWVAMKQMYRGQLEFYTLNSLDFYHVCSSGLPPDIMYDILEGYLPYTVKLLNIFIANA